MFRVVYFINCMSIVCMKYGMLSEKVLVEIWVFLRMIINICYKLRSFIYSR